MTSPLRSVNVDHVNRLMEAVRIGGALDMEKLLRVASDIGGRLNRTRSTNRLGGWERLTIPRDSSGFPGG